MKSYRIIIATIGACLLTPIIGAAGTLSDNLQAQVIDAGAMDMIPVWIKLTPVVNSRNLSRTATAAGQSARERHAFILDNLKSRHANAQQSIVATLKGLETTGKAQQVKTFWISNMVTALVAADQLDALAARDDVATIYAAPRVSSITPPDYRATSQIAMQFDSIPLNLTYIKANQVWGLGYDGTGRVICSFDSGVDGAHPALAASWKGNDGNHAAAWFDPVDRDTVPHLISGTGLSINHGTQVMGVMVGDDPDNGFRTGVAPGATWISAAVTDLPTEISHAILEGFEWAADPDGNPNTISDRPDVINHSWGFGRSAHGIGCEEIFFEAIDNVEALGIVNIFAAGNEGAASSTVTNPANRALDSIDCFAVGAVNAQDTTNVSIAGFSSRGPSDCQFTRTKPNVAAPGVAIATSSPPNLYVSVQGTSFAAPEVAGLVALMRQKNPNATVDEIKTAILSTTRTDHFPSAPNNDVGWGEIDCLAAVNALSAIQTEPNVRVYEFAYNLVSPGDTVEATVLLQNVGAEATGVSGILTSSDPDFTVLQGAVTFGTIEVGDTVRSAETLRIAISPTALDGSIVPLSFLLSVSGSTIPASLAILVEPARQRALATHDNGAIAFTISNFGMFGMGDVSIVPAQGAGFSYFGEDNYLWEGGLIVGKSTLQVSSGVHSYIYASDYDFSVANGGYMRFDEPGDKADQQSYSALTDRNAGQPLGIRMVQETYSFASPDDDYILIRYIVENDTNSTVADIYAGIFLDWDIVNYTSNAGGYETVDEFAWMAYNSAGSLSQYRGIKLVDGTLASAQTNTGTIVAVPGFAGNGYSTIEKFQSLVAGTSSSETYKTASTDLYQLVSAGPITVAVGQSDTIAFAILAGSTLVDITQAAADAQSKYDLIISSTDIEDPDENILPSSFALRQNYPNPFNPTTTIAFDLSRAAHYSLTIFNAMGQQVERFGGWSPAGTVSHTWNAEEYASGVYMYRLKIGEYTASRKMLLLK